MSVPSVIFADASWYGSLRGGVKFGGGGDAQFHDAASRWGIKGSNELSEGLTAVYRFEHKISTANAGQPGGRLAYVGLSGGFGNLSLGQVGNASYGATGAIVDNSGIWGNAYTGGDADGTSRTGNAISYAISTGGVSAQLDAVMDDRDSGNAVDELQLGLSLNLGDVGKLAFAHVQTEDHMVQGEDMYEIEGGTPTTYTVTNPTPAEYMLSGGHIKYAPVMLRGSGVSIEDGEVMVSKWMNGDMPFTGDAMPKVSVAFDEKAGTLGGETSVQPMIVTVVSAASDSVNVAGVGQDVSTDFDVSEDGKTYTTKACTANDTGCTSMQYFALQSQMDPTDADDATVQGVRFIDDPDNPGTLKPVTIHPKMVHFLAADATTVMVTAELEGTDEMNGGIESAKLHDTVTAKAGTGTSGSIVDNKDGKAAKLVMNTPDPEKEYGLKASHVAAEFGFGAVTGFVGYSQVESNESGSMKDKITHYGVRGSLGESGVGFLVQLRSEDLKGSAPMDADRDPYLFRMSKSLGDGASVYLEHANNDVKGKKAMTGVGLVVDF